jgi:hypothetical protein
MWLAGCTLVITPGDVARVRRDFTPDQTITALGRVPVAEYHDASDTAADSLCILRYRLLWVESTDYFFVYKNGHLWYWGTPAEIQRFDEGDAGRFARVVVRDYPP